MMTTVKKNLAKLSVIILALAAAYGYGRYMQPPKEVIKEVEVVKKDVRTVTRVITQPDGTVIKERTKEDKTITEKEKSSTTEARALWKVSVMAGYNLKDKEPEYALSAQKNVLGPMSLGLYGTNRGTVGLVLGYEF